jgi:hypothetical protein
MRSTARHIARRQSESFAPIRLGGIASRWDTHRPIATVATLGRRDFWKRGISE